MMKTIQELYNEVMASQELKKQFVEAAKAGKQEAFLKEHGCSATTEEVVAFLKTKVNQDAPLSAGEMENAAGGTCNTATAVEAFGSVVSGGIVCMVVLLASSSGELKDAGLHFGQESDDEGRLCNKNK